MFPIWATTSGRLNLPLSWQISPDYEARYFIADYHSLNTIRDPEVLKEYTYEVAASWLACGLDPKKTLIYRQSDIPRNI